MLPHQMNSTPHCRVSMAARRDQKSSPWRLRSRRAASGSRSTRLGKVASTSEASGCWPVETTSDPGGYRLASSPIHRAMPPPIGGKS